MPLTNDQESRHSAARRGPKRTEAKSLQTSCPTFSGGSQSFWHVDTSGNFLATRSCHALSILSLKRFCSWRGLCSLWCNLCLRQYMRLLSTSLSSLRVPAGTPAVTCSAICAHQAAAKNCYQAVLCDSTSRHRGCRSCQKCTLVLSEAQEVRRKSWGSFLHNFVEVCPHCLQVQAA